MAGPFKPTEFNPESMFHAPNVKFPGRNVAADGIQEQMNRDREFDRGQARDQFERDRYQAEREVKAMDAMLKDPRNAEGIAQAYGVQMTPQIQEMLQNPKIAQQMNEAIKMAKDSGLDRPQSIQEFVTGYLQSGGDPLKAMDAVTDKQSIKEIYYNNQMQAKTGSAVKPVTGYRYNPNTEMYEKIPGLDPSHYKRGNPKGTGNPLLDNPGEGDVPPAAAQPGELPQEIIDEIERRKLPAQTPQAAPRDDILPMPQPPYLTRE